MTCPRGYRPAQYGLLGRDGCVVGPPCVPLTGGGTTNALALVGIAAVGIVGYIALFAYLGGGAGQLVPPPRPRRRRQPFTD